MYLAVSKINFHQGAVAITEIRTAATTHFEFYKVSEIADINYLWYFFRSKSFLEILSRYIMFRGFKKEANFKFIKDIEIIIPPLLEQKSIANSLHLVQEARINDDGVVMS